MSEPIAIALVGCGGMGRRHLAAFIEFAKQGNGTLRLAAVCDRDEKILEEAREHYRREVGVEIPGYPDLESALEAGVELTGVDLALPTRLHHTVAVDAFEAGLHVFVEKPLALTIRAATVMIAAAERTGRVLAVSENFRRVPSNRAFAELIRTGGIGRPYWSTSELSIPAEMLHPSGGGDWYRDRSMSGSLVALEMGVHECDLTGYWFGQIERVSAEVRTFENEVKGSDGRPIAVTSEDTCFARLETELGVVANVTMTMAGHGEILGRRFAVGSTGSASSAEWEAWEGGRIELDGREPVGFAEYTDDFMTSLDPGELEKLFPKGSYRPDELALDIGDPLRYGVANGILDFVRAIRTGSEPEVGPGESLVALGAAMAMLESSRAGAAIDVDDVLMGDVDGWQAELDRDLGLLTSEESKG